MEAVETFHSSESLVPEIQFAGEKAVCVLYSAKRNESLHELRYRKFCQKVLIGSTLVQHQVLPPTAGAAKFHSMRVYLQICEWKGCRSRMSPKDWGWKFENTILLERKRTSLIAIILATNEQKFKNQILL